MSLKKNVVANFAGSVWSALMGLAFVPLYIRMMGVESYGIVGVFTALMGMLAVLDLGLSQAMNREMAKLSVDEQNPHRMVDTARTLEIVYWGVALIVGVLIALLATPIATYWLNPEQLTRDDLQQALWIMGLVIALRWPVSLYMGGMNGLQRQVDVNVILSIVATLQGGGALLVLWLVAPTIQAFLAWQVFMALFQVAVLRVVLWRSFAHCRSGRFDRRILSDIWRFAAGMSGISLLATILTQLDKVLLSKMLSLSEFGYYTFAANVASVLFRLVGPIFTAYYPRLTGLASGDNQAGLAAAYHQGSQLMAVLIIPVAFVLAFFSADILEIWTRDPKMVAHASLLISVLTIGNALNGLMTMPYALQLAYGRTRFALFQNIVAVIVLVPAIYFATTWWGAIGAASVWLLLNIGYIVIGIQIMHRYLLRGEKSNWYLNDTLKPLLSSLAICLIGWTLMQNDLGVVARIIVISATLGAATIAAMLSAGALRSNPQLRSMFRMRPL